MAVALFAMSATFLGAGSASASGLTFAIRWGDTNACWTPYGGHTTNNTDVVLFECGTADSNPAQYLWWIDDSGRLRYGGQCVLPYGGSTSQGADIVLFDCTPDNAAEQWYTDSAGHLLTFTGMCVVPYGGHTENETRLTQWPCPASPVQASVISEG